MKLHQLMTIVLGMTSVLSSCNQNSVCINGNPIPDCICTMEYNPVCGCDDVTYGNSCLASCAMVSEYTPGTCD